MATMTRADVIKGVLEYLRVIDGVDDVPAEDSTRVGYIVDSVHDQMRQQGRAPWALSAVPEYAQTPLIRVVAAECMPYYGKPMDAQGMRSAQAQLDDQERIRDLGIHVGFPEF